MTSTDANSHEPVTREELYALVWSEPMLKVAARYGVSSSYMARVCTRLNVPRPSRGYWAKLGVGKAPTAPPLPDPQPSDELNWRQGDDWPIKRPVLKPPSTIKRRRVSGVPKQTGDHKLVQDARAFFEIGGVARDTQYLKPSKRLLVDLTITKATLAKALSFANSLFNALEDRGRRVVISTVSECFRRQAIDEREPPVPARTWSELWTPGRPTVVYIGTVAIGLTIVEISEAVKVRYVAGKYVRESECVLPKRQRHGASSSWSTTKDFPTGRLLLQAYSPYHAATWIFQWKEKAGGSLEAQTPIIIKKLEGIISELARQVEKGERHAAIEKERWEAAQACWRKEEKERQAEKALANSKLLLLQIIAEWSQWQSIEAFFSAIERQLPALDTEVRAEIRFRLEAARKLLEVGSALDSLKMWRPPYES